MLCVLFSFYCFFAGLYHKATGDLLELMGNERRRDRSMVNHAHRETWRDTFGLRRSDWMLWLVTMFSQRDLNGCSVTQCAILVCASCSISFKKKNNGFPWVDVICWSQGNGLKFRKTYGTSGRYCIPAVHRMCLWKSQAAKLSCLSSGKQLPAEASSDSDSSTGPPTQASALTVIAVWHVKRWCS